MTADAGPASVSVVIAAYNAERWISQTLESVLSQTLPAFEVIVVDDGSTDRTASSARAFGGRIHYIAREHSGQPAARNAGIRAAAGQFVAFCDADDLWRPRKLEKQVDLAKASDLAWVVCDADWIDYDGIPADVRMPPMREGDVLKPLFLGNFIKSATPLIRRHVFEQVGYFDESGDARIGEDWDMWLRISARYPLGVVPQELATIRIHEGSMLARSTSGERLNGLLGVVERAVHRDPDRLGPIKSRAVANIWRAAGVQAFRGRRYEEARVCFHRLSDSLPGDPEALAYLLLCVLAIKAQQLAPGRRGHLW